MSASIHSLIASGTKLWLDSIDPELVRKNRALGATGATSNPIIIADLIRTGRFDGRLAELTHDGLDDEQIAWALTDELVSGAQQVFLDVWRTSSGDDGYVSYELDPLLEDVECGPEHDVRVRRYIDQGIQAAAGQPNRLIKIPATPAGIEALEELVAHGVNPNVTLVFSRRQYEEARDAAWRGAQRRESLKQFKSCYSIFVSRIDVYTEKHCPRLVPPAQGLTGILNAQRIWQANCEFWASLRCPLQQEIIFASTGVKNPADPAWKYVAALAGSDIQTNPPATNDAVASSGLQFKRQVDQLPSAEIVRQIDSNVDFDHMERTLMDEGIEKFAAPQRALLELIGRKRETLASV